MKLGSILIAIIVLLYEVGRFATTYDKLLVVFCDVGQGDAIFIQHRSFQLLVDGGLGSEVLTCIRTHIRPFDRNIELVVATHPDSDHIGGLASVLSQYAVDELLWNGEGKESTVFASFYSIVQSKEQDGMRLVVPDHGAVVEMTDRLVAEVWFPRGAAHKQIESTASNYETNLQDTYQGGRQTNDEANDGSIALYVHFGNSTILLMGDLEMDGEKTLESLGLLRKVTILKVGHHGSKSSSGESFVAQTQPEYAVLSVGKNNRFGHPSLEVMSRFDRVKSNIVRTDLLGDIVFLSNGNRVLTI